MTFTDEDLDEAELGGFLSRRPSEDVSEVDLLYLLVLLLLSNY